MSNNLAWGPTPEEKEMLAQRNKEGRVNTVTKKMAVGENYVRIRGTRHFYKSHWFAKVQRTAYCPKPHGTCPVCDHPNRQALKNKAEELEKARLAADKNNTKKTPTEIDLWKKYYSYKPDLFFVANILDRTDGKIKVWKFSEHLKERIDQLYTKHGDPNGYDLVITRTGTGKETRYQIDPEVEKNSRPLTEAELALPLPDLVKMFKPTPTETIQAYLEGRIPEKKSKVGAAKNAEPAVQETLETEPPSELNENFSSEDLGELGELGDL